VKKSDLIQETDGWLNDLAGYIKRISWSGEGLSASQALLQGNYQKQNL
jgi:hypothetical protein